MCSSDLFADCFELTSVTLSVSLESIYSDAFRNCTNLTTIAIPSRYINNAFAGSGLISVDIHRRVEGLYGNTFEGSNKLKTINVDDANPYFSSVEGVVFNKDKTTIICYPEGKTDSLYSIPSSVKTIGWQVFSGIDSLKVVTIPESVTAIQKNAFLIQGLTVETENRTPQLVEIEAFGPDSVVSVNTLVVPDGTSALYKNTKVWRDFGWIIEKSEVANEFVVSNVNPIVYPNPVGNVLNVRCDESHIGQICRIFGINGLRIAEFSIKDTNTVIDVSGYPAGTYMLIVGNSNQVAKFIKMR